MIKNCGLYIRVSTDLQASEIEGSLKTQQQRLEEEIARRSSREVRWTASRIYIEKGKSGKDTNRPEFQRMLRDIEAGIINTVACTELSRLSRSVSDFLHFVDFLKLHNCDFICLKQQFDTTTAHGKMFLTLVMALAEFERELTSERTRAHMLARKERGLWNGGRIDGYDLDPTRKGYLVVNETEAEVIRFIFRTYLETQSCTRTRDIVNQKGYRTKSYTARRGAFHPPREFDKNKIFKILKSPVYIGKIEANKRNKGKDDVPEAERYRLVDGVH